MTFTEIALFGVGLAMDAFAVAICKGLCMRKMNYFQGFIIALFFGAFQALMPFAGYWLGKSFEKHITSVDHWIAFALLLYIGGKMIKEAFDKEEISCDANEHKLKIRELFVLSVATSIDALAVGIAFSFEPGVNIYENVIIIGAITFVISYLGVIIGNKFGMRYKQKAEIAGGSILVLLGVKMLLEGVGIL